MTTYHVNQDLSMELESGGISGEPYITHKTS